MMRRSRPGFTLFELIISIALSGTLLALIGTAINLYLTRVDMSRDRVEEAQLARSVLSMIASDLRATAVYQPQDVSSVSELMANAASFDVDSIDEATSGSSLGGASSPGGTSTPGGLATVGSSGSLGGASSTSGSSSAGTSPSTSTATQDSEMPLGITGSIGDVYVDTHRLPQGNELFSSATGYTNAPMATTNGNAMSAIAGTSWGSTPPPNDLRTIRYFVRQGDRTEKSGRAATSLAPNLQMNAGGLVRQEIPRAARLFAEQNGNSGLMESGQRLIAPEVIHMELRYFDGQQVVNIWDMNEAQRLPLAVEVSIWLVSADEAAKAGSSIYNQQSLLSNARQYRQTVYLPMAMLSQSGASTGASSGSSSTSSTTTGSSTTSGNSQTGFGSELGTGQQ